MTPRIRYSTEPPRRTTRLSRREQQVLALIAAGRTSQQTARLLDISVHTVATYLTRIRAKLGAPTLAHLVRAAMRLGLVDPASTPA